MKKIRKIRMTLMMFAFMFGLMNVGALRAQAASPSVDKSVTYNIYKDLTRLENLYWFVMLFKMQK